MARVQELAPEDQLGPRPTKEGAIDLTGGKVFLSDPAQHASLVAIVAKHGLEKTILFDDRHMAYHAVFRILLRSIHTVHFFWNKKEMLHDSDLRVYIDSIDLFRKCWTSFSWKPTVWVHWVCAHSSFYMATYRTLSSFTSIPTEHRHQTFKMDLRHAFEGWKFKNALLTKRWLCRVVELDALDQGLRILSQTADLDNDGIFEHRRKKPKMI